MTTRPISTNGSDSTKATVAREDRARLVREVLALAGVLVLPAVVLEEVVADLPGEIDAVALLEEALLRGGEGVVGLVAEGEVGVAGIEGGRRRGVVVVAEVRGELGDLVARHGLDGVHGVAVRGRWRPTARRRPST